MCKCVNIKMGSYENQTDLYLPWKNERLVGIDNCILDEIKYLWSMGIRTAESCCGHNVAPSFIMVEDESISKMLLIGYDNHNLFPDRKDMFKSKLI